ncbi:Spindle-defective protein 2 [Toxocara canis]|uniref:Spindle-defective protein 2 n=1 Tax=Toxocara canis TaxID=6265 RepID=A0A0B2UW97_TOXCA|nr:Spindle-defective protein 2 [Toxocara canis]
MNGRVFVGIKAGVMDDLRLQEDNFEDDDGNDLLNDGDSVYDGDFSFHEEEVDQGDVDSPYEGTEGVQLEGMQNAQRFPPSVAMSRLETITEESRITSDGNEELEKSRISPRQGFGATQVTTVNSKNDENKTEFFKPDAEFWKRDEENFKLATLLEKNDWRFNRTHQEKEHSWEPSIVNSTPPIPPVEGDRLLKFCNKDTVVMPEEANALLHDGASRIMQQDVQASSVAERSIVVVPEDQTAPKMSTPYAEKNTTRSHLDDLSRDCASISAISLAPDWTTPVAARSHHLGSIALGKVAFLEPKRSMAFLPVLKEESVLSSSAIDRALSESRVGSMNDSQLVAALHKARKRTEEIFKVPDLLRSYSHTQTGATLKENRRIRQRGVEPLRSNTVIANAHTETNDEMVTVGSKSLSKSLSKSRPSEKHGLQNIPVAGGDAVLESRSHGGHPAKQRYSKHTANTNTSLNQNSSQKKTAKVVRSVSLPFSFPTSSSNQLDDGKHYLACDTPAVWFGCTEVERPVMHTIRLTNVSRTTLFLEISLRSNNAAFQAIAYFEYLEAYHLQEAGSVILKRKENYALHLTFNPNTGAFFKNAIRIVVGNVEHISYSIPVTGAGGTAILVLKEQGGDISRLRDGSFVYTTSNPISVPLELKNVGVRDAFAFLSVIDPKTKEPIESAKVLPTDKVVIMRRQRQKFEVHIEEHLDEGNVETRSGFGSTSSLCGRKHYVVRVIWAEELLRYRLKCAERERHEDWNVDGISFTRSRFLNEENAKITAACHGPYGIHDRDTFECRLRVLCISVADNRRLATWQSSSVQRGQEEAQVVLEPDTTLAPDATMGIIQDVTVLTPKAKR